jgi:hypothetical protein
MTFFNLQQETTMTLSNSNCRGGVHTVIRLSLLTVVLFAGVSVAEAQWTTDTSTNNIYYNSGNVGIGTLPGGPFEVWKQTSPVIYVTRDASGGSGKNQTLAIGLDGSAGRAYVDSTHYSSGGYPLDFRVRSVTAMTVDVGGNIGIGTTAPVVRGGAAYGLNISGALDRGIQIDSTSGNGNILFTGSSSGTGNMYVTNNSSASLFFGTGSYVSQQMIINSAGNVGIGTTSPYTKLQIAGGDISIDADHSIRKAGDNSIIAYSSSLPGIVVGSGTTTDQVIINAGGYERARILTNGNVGIGTTGPDGKLGIVTATNTYALRTSGGNLETYLYHGSGGGIWYTNATNGFTINNQSGPFALSANNAEVIRITNGGNVGIGRTDPSYKLDVNGTINSSSTITANNIIAKYQDVAEWVPSSEKLVAGTVVVLDSTKSNQVTSSSVSYDTRVAGVVSEQPGIALGEKSDGKVLVATTGRVRVKVDASKGAIHIGDLLVTSDLPGVAMKSEPVEFAGRKMHMPGTLIGKALEPLEKGTGQILVLLSLQ